MQIGDVLAGKYRVERVLGRGGMGEVVKATNLMLGQPVAMKFLLPEMASQPVIVQRFMREARAAVQLKSEHVARVLDVGTLDNTRPFIVFEYLEGADLEHTGALPVGEIIDLVVQATEAFAEAHGKGIIHRDIKPANLFVTRAPDGAPSLKVLDFGISKVDAASTPDLTATSTMLGTPSYASPEQLMSTRTVDHRADIYSLGIVLYQLIEGRLPFEAESLTDLAIRVMMTPLPPITANIPAPLIGVIERCCEKDAAKRFQSMAELGRALEPFAKSRLVVVAPAKQALSEREPARWPIPVAVGSLLVIASIGFLAWYSKANKSPRPASDQGPAVHEMAVQPPSAPPPDPPVDALDLADAGMPAPIDAAASTVDALDRQTKVRPKHVVRPKPVPQPAGPDVDRDGDGIPDVR